MLECFGESGTPRIAESGGIREFHRQSFGVASGGWDIYYGVIWGTRTAFVAGIVITLITLVIGVLIGTFSAYYGGVIDLVMQRITEIFMTFPFLMAALTAAVDSGELLMEHVYPAKPEALPLMKQTLSVLFTQAQVYDVRVDVTGAAEMTSSCPT